MDIISDYIHFNVLGALQVSLSDTILSTFAPSRPDVQCAPANLEEAKLDFLTITIKVLLL